MKINGYIFKLSGSYDPIFDTLGLTEDECLNKVRDLGIMPPIEHQDFRDNLLYKQDLDRIGTVLEVCITIEPVK